MACVPVALRALRIFSSACVFSCVRCVFRCVKFLSLRILLRALRIRCVFFLSLRILLRRLRIRCVKFRSLRILLRALRILLRISLRNGLALRALRALRCVRRMEIGLYCQYGVYIRFVTVFIGLHLIHGNTLLCDTCTLC